MFAYHSGSQQLVFLDPESRRAQAFSIAALRMLGWSADHENCSKSLPRFEPPAPKPALTAAASDGAIRQAAAQEKGRRAFEAKIRGR